MKTKSIGYSYPTSTNAKRFGFARSGCYVVSLCVGDRSRDLAGFASLEDAELFAGKLAEPWDRFTYGARPWESGAK